MKRVVVGAGCCDRSECWYLDSVALEYEVVIGFDFVFLHTRLHIAQHVAYGFVGDRGGLSVSFDLFRFLDSAEAAYCLVHIPYLQIRISVFQLGSEALLFVMWILHFPACHIHVGYLYIISEHESGDAVAPCVLIKDGLDPCNFLYMFLIKFQTGIHGLPGTGYMHEQRFRYFPVQLCDKEDRAYDFKADQVQEVSVRLKKIAFIVC